VGKNLALCLAAKWGVEWQRWVIFDVWGARLPLPLFTQKLTSACAAAAGNRNKTAVVLVKLIAL
jgi:hypothetical protein